MSVDLESQILAELTKDTGPNLSAHQLTEKFGCTFEEAHNASLALAEKTMREPRTVMVYNERDKHEQVVDFYVSISDVDD
jgi:hypothetical protein